MLVENPGVLFGGNVQTLGEILDVCLAEEGRDLERGCVARDVVVVLDSFNHVALANDLEEFFGGNHVEVVERDFEVAEITSVLFEGRRVSESTLIVRYRPLRSAHHAQVVVSVGVDAANKRVLG